MLVSTNGKNVNFDIELYTCRQICYSGFGSEVAFN